MIRIKYNKTLPLLSISLGLIIAVLFVVYPLPSNKDAWWLPPALILLNIPLLFIDYIVISDKDIVVKNQWGGVLRRYAINHLSEVSVEHNRIFISKPGKKEEVKFRRLLAARKGLRALNSQLNSL